MRTCLKCFRPLADGDQFLHAACARTVFATAQIPELDIDEELFRLGAIVQLERGRGLTGVQKKLSAELEEAEAPGYTNASRRLVLRDALAGYIVKPQTEDYPELPENEALCMQLAELVGLPVVPHTLLRTTGAGLAYVTRRIDRTDTGAALPQEDMAQLTDRLTEEKYGGSHEQIGKAIARYSARPRIDLVTYYRAVLFCFVIGNADAHLKNWSLHRPGADWRFMPLYDLVSTRLVIPERDDPEELCLMLNGRRRKFGGRDFAAFAKTLGIPEAQASAQVRGLVKARGKLVGCVAGSYLSEGRKGALVELMGERLGRIG